MSDRLQIEAMHTERQLITAVNQLRAALAFAQPQTWTMDMCRQRWPSLPAETIAALAAERIGYRGEPRKLVLALDEVIALDAEIAGRLRSQRSTPVAFRRTA